jgi:putative restriction endonuclease
VATSRAKTAAGRVWYDDQREAHRQIYTGDDVVDYAFTGTEPNSADNRLLLDAMQQQIPVIISSALRPVAISPSFRRSFWDGTPSGYESISHSEGS